MSSELSWLRRRANKRAEIGPWELREALRSRSCELRAILEDRKDRHKDDARVNRLANEALEELKKADAALTHEHFRYKMGAHIAVGQIHVDTAHNLLVRLSAPGEIIAMMPGIRALVATYLSSDDPRRLHVEQLAQAPGMIDETQREMILDAVGVARQKSIRETLRVRSFVSIVSWVAAFLALGAVVVAILGAFFEDTIPLCFTPSRGFAESGYIVVCPVGMNPNPMGGDDINRSEAMTTSAADYLVVEIVGLIAAGIAAAMTLHRIKGTSTPYNVPVVLALLKLPTGALTAVLGLLLMRGNFIPGLSALDSTPQIIGWAALLGYSQQLFTRLVDDQAQSLLSALGQPGSAPPPTPTLPPSAPASTLAASTPPAQTP